MTSAPAPIAHLRREASVALTLGSAVIAAAGAHLAIPAVPEVAWLLTPMLALVGLLAASHGPRQRDDAAVVWTALGGAMIAVPAAFCAASDPWVCGALFAATPCGLALYAAWSVLLGRLRPLCREATLEDVDLARVHAGRWLLTVGVLGLVVGILDADRLSGSLGGGAALIGGVQWLAGAIGRRSRARLVGAVRRGEVKGWAIVSGRRFGAQSLAGLPRVARTACPDVLVRATGRGPYRDGVSPQALVPALGGGSSPVGWQPPGPLARGSAALIGAVFAPFVALTLGVATARTLPTDGADPGVLVGWTLLVSGPATGLLVGALARLAPPVRSAALALALATYCLGAPLLCAALAAAARGLG